MYGCGRRSWWCYSAYLRASHMFRYACCAHRTPYRRLEKPGPLPLLCCHGMQIRLEHTNSEHFCQSHDMHCQRVLTTLRTEPNCNVVCRQIYVYVEDGEMRGACGGHGQVSGAMVTRAALQYILVWMERPNGGWDEECIAALYGFCVCFCVR